MNKAQISQFLRRAKLLHLGDNIRFRLQWFKNHTANQKFQQENPEIVLPPDYLMYESFQLHYRKYYEGGRATARWLLQLFKAHQKIEGANILDWGCGPARIVRHLPELTNRQANIYATDYNTDTIHWCKGHLPGIHFSNNALTPPLYYQNDFFNIAYGLSIFTHLSKPLHYDWLAELMRILKVGGILLLTTQGDVFLEKMIETEQQQYQKGELVVRGNVKEGHRVYSAFQPPSFMQALVAPFAEVVAFIPGKVVQGKPEQDLWIFKKV